MAILNVKLSKHIVKEPDMPTPPKPEKELTLLEIGQKINGLQFNIDQSIDLSQFSDEVVLSADNQDGYDFVIRYYDLKDFGANGKALFIDNSIGNFGGFYYLYSDTNINIDGIEIKKGWNLEILDKDNIYKLPEEYTVSEIDKSAKNWNGTFIGAITEEVQGLSMLKVNQQIGGFDFGNVQNGEISPEMENFLASVDVSNGSLYEIVGLQEDNVEGSLSIGYIEQVHYLAFNTLVDKKEDKGVLIYLDKDDSDFGARGWHNISEGKVGLVSSDKMRITSINDTIPPTWNGVLIGAVEKEISQPLPQPTLTQFYKNQTGIIGFQVNTEALTESQMDEFVANAPVRENEELVSISGDKGVYVMRGADGDGNEVNVFMAQGDESADVFAVIYVDRYAKLPIDGDTYLDKGWYTLFDSDWENVQPVSGVVNLYFSEENINNPEHIYSISDYFNAYNGIVVGAIISDVNPVVPPTKFTPIYENDTFNAFRFNTELDLETMTKLCENIIDKNSVDTGSTTTDLVLFTYPDSSLGSIVLIYNKDYDYFWIRHISKEYGETEIWSSNFSPTGIVGWQGLVGDILPLNNYVQVSYVNLNDEWNGTVIGKINV